MAQKPKSTKDFLKEHFDALRARKVARDVAVAPKVAELEAINLQIETLRIQAKALSHEIKEYGRADGENVANLDAEIAQVALALGANKMSDGAVAE